MKFLHSMLRVSDPDATVGFFKLLGLEERRRKEVPEGKFTLIFIGVPGDEGGEVELTHNWDEAGYDGGRNFGHLAFEVDDIYATCRRLDGQWRDDQPPAARRAYGVRQKSPTEFRSSCCRRAEACRPPSPGPPCPTREAGDAGARNRRGSGLCRQLSLAGP